MRTISAILIALAALATNACRLDMQDQPKYLPLQASSFFADGRAARPVPAGTISRDALNDTDTFHTGVDNGEPVTTIPVPVNLALLQRGEERFNIFCTPCHGYLGDGDGMVARRGFKQPADLVSDRIREVPPGYIFEVITNGYGAMPDHAEQIPPADRWAIVAYIRALQLSRNATLADVPAEGRAQLETQRQ